MGRSSVATQRRLARAVAPDVSGIGVHAPRIRAASTAALRALSTPTHATGTPGGICATDSSASSPPATAVRDRSQRDVAPELLARKLDHVGGSISRRAGGSRIVAESGHAQHPPAGRHQRTLPIARGPGVSYLDIAWDPVQARDHIAAR